MAEVAELDDVLTDTVSVEDDDAAVSDSDDDAVADLAADVGFNTVRPDAPDETA